MDLVAIRNIIEAPGPDDLQTRILETVEAFMLVGLLKIG